MKRELVVPRTGAATKLHAVLANSTRARVYNNVVRCLLLNMVKFLRLIVIRMKLNGWEDNLWPRGMMLDKQVGSNSNRFPFWGWPAALPVYPWRTTLAQARWVGRRLLCVRCFCYEHDLLVNIGHD